MCADFQYYLNRTGPRGPQGYKGDKGDDGKTPVPRTGTNTPIETTVIFDTGDGNPYETPNLKYPIEDRGGNVVMLDRTNNTQYYGTPDQATDNYYGIVKLATPESVLVDPLDNDVVTYELFDDNNQAVKTVTDGLAGDITQLNTDLGAEVTNRTNADTQLTNKINTDVGNEATARSNADTALSGRIDNLTTTKADKSDVYTKTQTDSLLNNKSNVGHTHNYNEITNKPDIGNGTITITQGGVVKGSFTTNQLSNQTIALESGGGGGGTTYTEGDAIDLTNNTISVKYDNNTLKLNGSGQLYADIPTPATVDQTYNASSTNAQSGVAIAGAGFLNGSIVQSPLQYLPDTTDSLTYKNVNTSTMVGNGKGIKCYYYEYGQIYKSVYVGTSSGYESLISYSDKTALISNESLTWFETRINNGINFAFRHVGTSSTYTAVLGHYENGSFIPDIISGNTSNYIFAPIYFITTDNLYYAASSGPTPHETIGFYLNGLTLTIATTGNGAAKTSVTITQTEADILNAITHIRIYKNDYSISTLTLSDIKVINPTNTTPVTDGGATTRQARFGSGTNIFDAHPASLSLKYDSNALSVNASNELTVPTATTSSLGLVQPDGTTVTINDGIISATGSAPSNMVTTDTDQYITGSKVFYGNLKRTYGTGNGIIELNIETNENIPYVNFGRRQGNLYAQSISKLPYSGSNDEGLSFNIGNSGSPKLYVNRTSTSPATTAPTNFLIEKDMLDGNTISYNSTTGKISATGGGGGSSPIRKTITQSSANVSVSSGTVTVTDNDVSTSTLVTLYPGDTTTETWLANNMTSNIITEGSGSFTFNINGNLPSTFSMYYIIQEVS